MSTLRVAALAVAVLTLITVFSFTTADNSYADLTGCISYGTGLCVYVSKDGKKMRAGEARRYYILPKMAAPKVTDEHFHNISKIAWYRGVEKFWVLAESGTEEIYDMKTQAIVSKGEDEMIHVLVVGEFFAKYTCPKDWSIFYHQEFPACFLVKYHRYNLMSFTECTRECQSAGSQLAVFDMKEQLDLVVSNFPGQNNLNTPLCGSGHMQWYCQTLWIGTRLPNHAGKRYYIPYNLDGSEVRYIVWNKAVDEPNGFGASGQFDERCIQVFVTNYDNYGPYSWNDIDCNKPISGCICRKSVDRT